MENVDQSEIEKFSALASKWWDVEGEFKPLHQINPLRVNYILERVNGLYAKTVVDVGCGGGILSEALANEGANVVGLDMATESLQVAKLHGLESNIKVDYRCSSAEKYAEKHLSSADLVVCLEMLEHVPDPGSVVKACSDIVKPGGDVVFSTLNRSSKSWFMAILAAERILRLVPKGTHKHQKFIRPSELLNYIEQSGLVAQHTTGLHLNVINWSYFLSDKNIDVNYFIHCKKPEEENT